MATKRGKTLQAKALARRTIKKLKRHVRRHDARVKFCEDDMARIARERAEVEAANAADIAAEAEAVAAAEAGVASSAEAA